MAFLIVAAHQDDEMLGMGVLLGSLKPSCTFVHVTDGAPRSGSDASNAGCASWREYSALRQTEFQRALSFAALPRPAAICLDCPDQQAVFRIAEHAERLAGILKNVRPSVVFTHAYEGGHPDHDSTAASVHAALRIANTGCALAEFAGYHAAGAAMECEAFLNSDDVFSPPLTPRESRWKREVLNCYASQSGVLAQFPLRHEPLRPGRPCDFSRPPHDGPLYYDRFDWGVHSSEWRELARRAFGELRIPCAC